jgi:hypothetical protein
VSFLSVILFSCIETYDSEKGHIFLQFHFTRVMKKYCGPEKGRTGFCHLTPLSQIQVSNFLSTYLYNPTGFYHLHTLVLKIEAACLSETLVFLYKTTLCHNPEGQSLNDHCHEDHRSYVIGMVYSYRALN